MREELSSILHSKKLREEWTKSDSTYYRHIPLIAKAWLNLWNSNRKQTHQKDTSEWIYISKGKKKYFTHLSENNADEDTSENNADKDTSENNADENASHRSRSKRSRSIVYPSVASDVSPSSFESSNEETFKQREQQLLESITNCIQKLESIQNCQDKSKLDKTLMDLIESMKLSNIKNISLHLLFNFFLN
jgi:hypothetical protein